VANRDISASIPLDGFGLCRSAPAARRGHRRAQLDGAGQHADPRVTYATCALHHRPAGLSPGNGEAAQIQESVNGADHFRLLDGRGVDRDTGFGQPRGDIGLAIDRRALLHVGDGARKVAGPALASDVKVHALAGLADPFSDLDGPYQVVALGLDANRA
jgi:hypothetical protein